MPYDYIKSNTLAVYFHPIMRSLCVHHTWLHRKKKIFQDVLESSGANNFFTLVRYNPPELLEDYNYFKKLEKQEKEKQRISDEDDLKTLSSSPSEEAETAEDIIFTLFGPRVWEHNGELWAGSSSIGRTLPPAV